MLAACSGGPDSTALAATLAALAPSLRVSITIGHVNHGIRGTESDLDEGAARELASALGLPFFARRVDVPGLRCERGGSVEEVARDARLAALEEMRVEAGAELVATGHHLDDQAETVLFRILRGSGLTGLAGMSWGPAGGTIRPFLGTRREAIREALGRWGLAWREDSSNRSLEHARNRLRHELLPLLAREWNPEIAIALARLAELAATDDAALDDAAQAALERAVKLSSPERILLDRSTLCQYPSGIAQRLMRNAARALRTVHAPLSYAETMRLVALAGRRGEVVLRKRIRAWGGAATVALESVDAWTGPTHVEIDGRTSIPCWGTLIAERVAGPNATSDHRVAVISVPASGPYAALRRWRRGDRIADPDRGGSRTIADIAREASPRVDPRELVVLTSGERVMWVPELDATDRMYRGERGSPVRFAWEPLGGEHGA